MPIYVLRCGGGHTFEVMQSFAAPLPACPDCGSATGKIPAPFAIGGRAVRSLPPPPEAMPQTWRGTCNGNREYVTELRRIAERRRDVEDRHPELAGDRRPVLAHEGRFAAAPLRAGDEPGAVPRGAHLAHGHEESHGPAEAHGAADIASSLSTSSSAAACKPRTCARAASFPPD
jgi:putative FmdB family regulatory protein